MNLVDKDEPSALRLRVMAPNRGCNAVRGQSHFSSKLILRMDDTEEVDLLAGYRLLLPAES